VRQSVAGGTGNDTVTIDASLDGGLGNDIVRGQGGASDTVVGGGGVAATFHLMPTESRSGIDRSGQGGFRGCKAPHTGSRHRDRGTGQRPRRSRFAASLC
jgi:hypothetical protein